MYQVLGLLPLCSSIRPDTPFIASDSAKPTPSAVALLMSPLMLPALRSQPMPVHEPRAVWVRMALTRLES